jgi:hypothetical protein
VDATVRLIVGGFAPGHNKETLYPLVLARLGDAGDREKDPDTRVKAILRTVMTEAEASSAVHPAGSPDSRTRP